MSALSYLQGPQGYPGYRQQHLKHEPERCGILSAGITDSNAPVQMRVTQNYDVFHTQILGLDPTKTVSVAEIDHYLQFFNVQNELTFLRTKIQNNTAEQLHIPTKHNAIIYVNNISAAAIAIAAVRNANPFVATEAAKDTLCAAINDFISNSDRLYKERIIPAK